jgi:hypothetical protein
VNDLPEARNFLPVHDLSRAASRLRVLASDPSNSNYRQTSTPDNDEGERQDEADLVGDVFLQFTVSRVTNGKVASRRAV